MSAQTAQFFLVESETEPIDTTSGMTPFHDESGRTWKEYEFVKAESEQDAMSRVKRSQWAAPLRFRTFQSPTSLAEVEKALAEADRIIDIYDLGSELKSPNFRSLRYNKGRWTAHEQSERDSNKWYEVNLNRIDVVHIRNSVLENLSDLLDLKVSEEELLEHNQQSLLDVYASLIGYAGGYRVYNTPKGIVILGRR